MECIGSLVYVGKTLYVSEPDIRFYVPVECGSFNPFTHRDLHFLKKKFKSLAPTSCVSKTSVKGEGRPKTSLFSLKFHALSNGSYESSGNRFVPEI